MPSPAQNAPSRARARVDMTEAEFVEYPMLFSSEMVRAILAGVKGQTRRYVMPRNSLVNGAGPCMKRDPDFICAWPNLDFGKAWIDNGPSPAGNPGPYLKVPGGDESVQRVYSRIQPGDELWVRETWCQPEPDDRTSVAYRADMSGCALAEEKAVRRVVSGCAPWKPSIHMPRWASRLTLKVTEVRPQRLQDISARDALCEGVEGPCILDNFQRLWDSINGERPGCSWADNPWVWAISFRRVTP
jgi:hypothetical protein